MKFKVPACLKKVGFFVSCHKAEIATGVSVASGIGAIITANQAGRKIDKIMDKNNQLVAEAKERGDRKEVKKARRKAAIDIAKCYAPTVILGGLSVGTNIAGYKVAKKENGILTAALVARIAAERKLKENVKKECGDEADRVTRLQPTEEVIVGEDGNNVIRVSYNPLSSFTYILKPGNPYMTKDPQRTLEGLLEKQNYYEKQRIEQGHVFLEEVLRGLYIRPNVESHLGGWLDSLEPDSHVDFGISDIDNIQVQRFLEGRDTELILEFNCLQNIVEKVYSPQWNTGRYLYREGWPYSRSLKEEYNETES